MLLELSQLAFTVCKEDFFFFFFNFSVCNTLDICLVTFFFSLVFWVPEFNIIASLFVSFRLHRVYCGISAFVFRFSFFSSFILYLFCISLPFRFPFFNFYFFFFS
ncbi:uncharacterized protein EURHEDRAFT_263036 [Aspergillus ruber CBS 135680]|uniref:Uncharacterized protein n=1 Tax=Aspergillus ruber (strain CBS 135680) TaxID=1388766 RepID=A0A017SLU5_ASPRC|nr:uncharacterized protein EURHEDRAFT_263036 [Aspergillus ruber CBS 135680]EYE97922.1 hypothetical protein EURHEDRAFT_263036 [Aspergillus ruber CBS 135680]